jgi:hypothetical protein
MKTIALQVAAIVSATSTILAQQGPTAPRADPFAYPPNAVPVPGVPGAYTHPDIPAGYVLIQGDIQVRLVDLLLYRAGVDGVFAANLWPSIPLIGTIVPYWFDSNVSQTNRTRALSAMSDIASRTGVIFTEWTPGTNSYIVFRASNGNSSPVGMQGGPQTINLVSWGAHFVIVHEIYHSLGFHHQQSASNRNTYVTINESNIQSGEGHNFDIASGATAYGYDFDSFMHYDRCAFSIACPPGSGCECLTGQQTITVNQPWTAQWQDRIGQRDHFSYLDEIVCRGLYPGLLSLDYWWEPGGTGSGFSLTHPSGAQSLSDLLNNRPAGSTVFIKSNGSYSAVGTYSNPITIHAPLGATLGD